MKMFSSCTFTIVDGGIIIRSAGESYDFYEIRNEHLTVHPLPKMKYLIECSRQFLLFQGHEEINSSIYDLKAKWEHKLDATYIGLKVIRQIPALLLLQTRDLFFVLKALAPKNAVHPCMFFGYRALHQPPEISRHFMNLKHVPCWTSPDIFVNL